MSLADAYEKEGEKEARETLFLETQKAICPIANKPCIRTQLKTAPFPEICIVDMGDSGLWRCSRFSGSSYEAWKRKEIQKLQTKLDRLKPKRKSRLIHIIHEILH